MATVSLTGLYRLKSPALSSYPESQDAWKLTLSDFPDEWEGGARHKHRVWGTFAFNTLKGVMVIQGVRRNTITPTTPPTTGTTASGPDGSRRPRRSGAFPPSDCAVEAAVQGPVQQTTTEREGREVAGSKPSRRPDRMGPTRADLLKLFDCTWRVGDTLCFRWRGCREPDVMGVPVEESPLLRYVAPRTSGNAPFSGSGGRRTVDEPASPSGDGDSDGSDEVADTLPVIPIDPNSPAFRKPPAWTGECEITFVDENDFELLWKEEGAEFPFDGRRVPGGEEAVESSKSWAVLDGYGRDWYQLCHRVTRVGDWSGDWAALEARARR